MKVSVLVCAFGDDKWEQLARTHAAPSAQAEAQGAHETILCYDRLGTLASVRNEGAELAEGDWLCFLDADDQLCPGYLDAMKAAMRHWNLSRRGDLIYNPLLLAPAVQYLRRGRVSGAPAIPNAGRWPDLNECVIGTLVPRRLFLEVGGFRELPSLEDYDLWLRCVRAGARIAHVPDAVYCIHVSTGSRNSDQSVYDKLRAEHAEVWA